MSDLRSACIEAIGLAEHQAYYFNEGVQDVGDDLMAAAALDALLGVLEEHAVPMMCVSVLSKAWAVCEKPDADVLVVDLAVLREDK